MLPKDSDLTFDDLATWKLELMAVQLREQGLKVQEIADLLGKGTSTIERWLKKAGTTKKG
jgi:transposase